VERFQQAAKLAAALRHPNLVEIYDLGVRHREHYCAMELVAAVRSSRSSISCRSTSRSARRSTRARSRARCCANSGGSFRRRPAKTRAPRNGWRCRPRARPERGGQRGANPRKSSLAAGRRDAKRRARGSPKRVDSKGLSPLQPAARLRDGRNRRRPPSRALA
jgi:hypothetical protein